MKPYKILFLCIVILAPVKHIAQHRSVMEVTADTEKKILHVRQELHFHNQTGDTLHSVVLNDWNNAYSDKNTPLAKRFSDEFVRSFHLANPSERGHTKIISIIDKDLRQLAWQRPEDHPDLVEIKKLTILPGERITITLLYDVKIPSDKFTKYGYDKNGGMNLKDWFLTPARYDGHDFVRYSNNNLDDIANSVSDFEVTLNTPIHIRAISDLDISSTIENKGVRTFSLNGKDRSTFSLFLTWQGEFMSFKNDVVDVFNSLEDKRSSDIQKAIIVDRVVRFTNERLGSYPFDKITVSQTDYERNPFYGLNQLPAFINVFPDDFLYELKFLKTYLNNYIKNSLKLDPRKDNWVFDAIQVYLMMEYIDENHMEATITGSLSSIKLFKNYNIFNLPFNGQYSYYYMLMARKNLDQPLAAPKNTLIKFNEQIASKYRAGLSLKYLDDYLGNDIIDKTITQFVADNRVKQQDASDFHAMLKKGTDKDIRWFSEIIIGSREIIDYKFDDVSRTADTVRFTLKSKTGVKVPIPVYGVTKGEVVFKKWLDGNQPDSVYTFTRNGAEKIVLNYKNEVPEYNLRNNWKSLKSFKINNRPIKFVFFKDLEDPYYNQILYVPTLTYNLYDGLTPGLRFYNKTILDKPFTYDINPAYSIKAQSLSGSASLSYNQYRRDSRLYNIRYYVTGSTFHYAPDASYVKLTPAVQFRIRPEDFRDNRKQYITLRQVIVDREPTDFVTEEDTEDYSVFNARYSNSRTEARNHFNFVSDVQLESKFGKTSMEFEYRNLFNDNREINLRLYAGAFLYNSTKSDYFSFALDRPTDYLFDYNYYGRSETSGLFSQQLIISEGGFKSKLATPYANQWITTLNAGFNIWNWIEAYGDVGFVKSHGTNANFVYDSGIRLNLVTDYFELYFPVYSNNGWEIAQAKYAEKIRFIVTLDPKILVNLFTRKWF